MATPQQRVEQQKADLVARYKLTSSMLDRKVGDEDMPNIKRIIPSFHNIAPVLLDRVDRTRIDADGRNEAQKIQMMLETWQDRNGDAATFDKLITAMLEVGEVGQATNVCKLLNTGSVSVADHEPESSVPRSYSAQLKGETLTFQGKEETVTISWKQGSFLGIGGDRSQTYTFCNYTLSSGAKIPVYVQQGYSMPSKLTINSDLQYGMQEGVLFFVYHDKSQKPYQHRFHCNALQQLAYGVNDMAKFSGVDLSWIVGDYLHNV